MAIDASIFGLANKPTVALANPMDQLNALAGAQNAVNQNRLFQGQAAVGRAYQQATQPDGTLDVNQLRSIIAADPTAAPAAQSANESAQSLGTSQQSMALRNMQAQNNALDSLSSLNGGAGPTHDQVMQTLQVGIKQGWLQPHNADAVLTGMPPGDDPQSMATRQHMIQTMGQQLSSAQERLQNLYGAPTVMGDGQQNQPGMVAGQLSPNRGAFVPSGAPIQQYPSRGDLLTQQPGIGPDGRPTVVPLGTRIQQQGRPDLAGPAGTPPGTVPSSLLPKGYTGRYAAPGAAPVAAAPGSPPMPASPDGSVPVGLAPGQAAEADAAVQHASQARDAANTYSTRMQPLLAAQQALANAKTGSGAEVLNTLRQTLQTFTPNMLDGFRPLLGSKEQDAAFDEARKYLTNYAANTPGANRSDAGGATAANANANVHISPLAAQQVVQAAIGMERMKQAQTMEFNESGMPGGQYDRFQSGLATKADPRAFAADLQTPDQRKAILDGPGRANYLASLRLGIKHGLVNIGTPGGS